MCVNCFLELTRMRNIADCQIYEIWTIRVNLRQSNQICITTKQFYFALRFFFFSYQIFFMHVTITKQYFFLSQIFLWTTIIPINILILILIYLYYNTSLHETNHILLIMCYTIFFLKTNFGTISGTVFMVFGPWSEVRSDLYCLLKKFKSRIAVGCDTGDKQICGNTWYHMPYASWCVWRGYL